MSVHCLTRLVTASAAMAMAVAVSAIEPGDVYREFTWKPDRKWQRVTGPDATNERARRFLPNAVNPVQVTDLEHAMRAEVQVELLQSHAGTINHRLRINGGDWISIPPARTIPGEAGAEEGGPHHWLSMRYPVVPISLDTLREGVNTLELTCSAGFGLGKHWPQILINGATVRVYYDPEHKPHANGKIEAASTWVSPGHIELGLAPAAGNPAPLRRVDFLGRYIGYDWQGEGVYDRFHYNYRRGELQHQLATAWHAPWRGQWDTEWLVDRDRPVEVVARLQDETGLFALTDPIPVNAAELSPSPRHHVRLFAPYAISQKWQTRANRRHSCRVDLPDNLAEVVEARVFFTAWNGHGADGIWVNDTLLAREVGLNHELSEHAMTVPVGALRPGANEFATTSADIHHGIEVQWPGFVLLLRFEEPDKSH